MEHHFTRRRNCWPALAGLGLLLGLGACTGTPPESAQAPAAAPAESAAAPGPDLAAGATLFARHCTPCHGADGRKGLNGAHDLTRSNLNATGRVYMVTNGLGQMPAFKAQLTPAEIDQVVAYSLTLR